MVSGRARPPFGLYARSGCHELVLVIPRIHMHGGRIYVGGIYVGGIRVGGICVHTFQVRPPRPAPIWSVWSIPGPMIFTMTLSLALSLSRSLVRGNDHMDGRRSSAFDSRLA